jgi:predicted ArsR family transcriptional regulator
MIGVKGASRMVGNWYQRFLASTRGRLIALLRRDPRTVDELAAQLDLTDNAVRAHLMTLERDGLVRQSGVRRSGGVGKPASAYDLTPEAERLFPRPYAAVLDGMLVALRDHLAPEQVEDILRESGQRLAAASGTVQPGHAPGHAPGDGRELRPRLEAAAAALNQLGGLAEVEERDGQLSVCGYSCVLEALTPTHPEVCRLSAAFVSEIAGAPMRDCCNRDGDTRCRFIPISPDAPADDAESAPERTRAS